MTCDQIQRRLSTWTNQGHSKGEEARIAAHLRHCNECRDFQAGVHRIEAAAVTLRQGLAAPPPRRYGRRLAPWLAVAGLVPAILILSARSSPAFADFRRLEAAVEQASDAHLLIRWRTGDHQQGPIRKVEEIWYSRGRWRKSAPPEGGGERIVLADEGGMWFYRADPATGKVQKRYELAAQPSKFDLETLAPQFMPQASKLELRRVGPDSYRGAGCELYEVLDATRTERLRFWLKSGTELPLHVEKDVRFGNGWRTNGTLDLEFDRDWPDGLFDPRSLVGPVSPR